jgi:hypothetical protein
VVSSSRYLTTNGVITDSGRSTTFGAHCLVMCLDSLEDDMSSPLRGSAARILRVLCYRERPRLTRSTITRRATCHIANRQFAGTQ